MNEDDWRDDEIEEALWCIEQKRLNTLLSPCPFCDGVATINFCEWGCCRASARYIECDCGISANADIEKWNNRTCDFWKYLENGEIECENLI
jgi:hypothetical protein